MEKAIAFSTSKTLELLFGCVPHDWNTITPFLDSPVGKNYRVELNKVMERLYPLRKLAEQGKGISVKQYNDALRLEEKKMEIKGWMLAQIPVWQYQNYEQKILH